MKWLPPIVAAIIAFFGGLAVAFFGAWQQRRAALEARVIELEKAMADLQESNDRLRRKNSVLERSLRAFRGWADGDGAWPG